MKKELYIFGTKLNASLKPYDIKKKYQDTNFSHPTHKYTERKTLHYIVNVRF